MEEVSTGVVAGGSSSDLKEAFVRLQPLCTQLSQAIRAGDAASSERADVMGLVAELGRVVPDLPPFGLHRCLDYLLMPLLALLSRRGSPTGLSLGQAQLESVLRVVEAAIERCGPVMELHGELTFASPRYLQLFHTMVETLAPPNASQPQEPGKPGQLTTTSSSVVPVTRTKVSGPQEDLKLRAVSCLQVMLRPWPPSSLLDGHDQLAGRPPFITSKSSLALAAYGISLLIDEATSATNRDLRVASLEALSSLCSRLASYKSGEAVAFVLPGVVSALGKIMLGDYKQGHRVMEAAIDLCSEIVSAVMSDESSKSLVSEAKPDTVHSASTPDQVTAILNSLAQSQGDTSKGKEKLTSSETKAQSGPNEPFTITRDEEWLQKTISNLRGLFSDVFRPSKLLLQQHWRVRMSLARCASRLLLECRLTLRTCTNLLMSTLVFLVRDDVAEVSDAAQAGIEQIIACQGDQFYAYVSDVLNEELISSLPRKMRDPDESAKLAAIRLLFNHIYIVKDRMNSLLSTSSFLARLSVSLLQILEFDVYDVQTQAGSGFQRQLVYLEQPSHSRLEEKSSNSIESDIYPKRTFHCFRSDAVEKVARLLCLYLGRYGDLHLLLDHFLQIIRDPRNRTFRSPTFFIINHLILGAAGIGLPEVDKRAYNDVSQEIGLVMEEYLDTSVWGLPSTNLPSSKTLQSSQVLNENAVSLSLLIEGLGNCAQIMGLSFEEHLMNVLHPLLEKLGDANGLVSRSAYTTLQRACFYCGYKSLPHLIAKNTDYLIDSISMRMKHLDLYPNTPQVLHAILEYGILKASEPVHGAGESQSEQDSQQADDIVWLLDDTIQSIFNGLDEHNAEYTLAFYRILESIVGVLARKYEREGWASKLPDPDDDPLLRLMKNRSSRADQDITPSPQAMASDANRDGEEAARLHPEGAEDRMAEIEKFFKEHHERKQKEQEEEQEDPNQMKDESEEEKPPVSKSREKERDMVVNILERCQHFVSARKREVRLSVLEIVSRCITVLSADRRMLLPAVHLIWRPLSMRFADQDRVQAIKSWEVVSVMGVHAGDFMLHRIKDDLWPAMRDRVIPEDYALLRREMHSLGSFSHTNSMAYRSQHAMLSCLSSLCRSVFALVINFGTSSSGRDLATGIFGSVYIYLDDALPGGLRSEATELIKRLALLSPSVREQLKKMEQESAGFYSTYLPFPYPPSSPPSVESSQSDNPPSGQSSSATLMTIRRTNSNKLHEDASPRVRGIKVRASVTAILAWLAAL